MQARTTHGEYFGGKESSEHAIWRGMIARCNNPNSKSYPRYGAVGITVCDRWKSFSNFLADMAGATLDRMDPFGNYEPTNCCWVSLSDQQKNKTCLSG